MRGHWATPVAAGLLAALLRIGAATGGEPARPPKPAEFANVFSFGYGGDKMPKDDARFAALLAKIKAAGFNTVHCVYTEQRLALCRKHGVKMMADLLAADAGHHVYKTVETAKALCQRLRGNPDLWGYNIWNDNFGKTGPGRLRDLRNVRTWDPTHPAYCGTYRTHGMRHLVTADVFGYYDFHWKRGPEAHFPHLMAYRAWARERDAWFYRWVWTDSGIPGKGNVNRGLYTVNTSIACGLKGVLWFLGSSLMNAETLEWNTTGADIAKVNRQVMPLATEIPTLGNPLAVYSTPITRTLKDRDLPDGKQEMMPPGLEKHAFPAEFWIKPESGEFVMGLFSDGAGRDAVFIANHNTYAAQDVTLRFSQRVKATVFNRQTGRWQPLPVRAGTIRFPLSPGGGELMRLEK